MAEMCSPTPKSVAEEGMGELTSMYWSCSCHRHATQTLTLLALYRTASYAQLKRRLHPCLTAR